MAEHLFNAAPVILIVDDQPSDVLMLSEAVRDLGEVHVASDGRMALEVARFCRPDLVLLDVWLPDGEGFSLLRELRQAGASLDVILLTAAREAGALQEAMRLGVVDFILKPVVFERLRDTLDKYCQNRAALAALADIDQQAVDADRKSVV